VLSLLVRYVLGPLARLIYRPAVHGLANIPRHGPVIFAANHLAAVDTAVISLVTPRRIRFLGKAEYFAGRGIKGRLLAALLGGLGFVPVNRANAQAGLAALGAGRQVLNGGGAFGIYPEGTRSLDGRLHRGHTGVAVLALTTGAPVIPVALAGTDALLPRGRRIPRPARVTVRFGRPLNFSRYHGLDTSPVIRRSVTDEIMYAILALSEQQYVDTYHRRPDDAAA
jgi:1-acyl-sn-glycerol-3-phosphate acyltransferase